MAKGPYREESVQAGMTVHMATKFWQWQESNFTPVDSWSPSINVYRMERRIELCVDLAGVEPATIDLRVEPGKLVLRGVRHAPEPPRRQDERVRIVSMEIDHGPFCRTIGMPELVDLSRVESQYANGLLWIRLPLRGEG